MSEQRALLTDTERAILSGEKDVKDNYRYSVESRVRTRLRDRLTDDVDLLQKNQPEMYQILEGVVCKESEDDDIAVSDSSEEDAALLSEEEAEEAQGAVEDLRDRDRLNAAEDAFENQAEAPTNSDAVQGLTKEQRDRLEENLTGSGDLLEARVDAIEKMYQELQRLGEATSDDLLDVIDPEAVRFTGGEKTSPEESSWSNLVKGKDTLSSLPGVEKPPTGNSTWRYMGETNE